MRFGIMMIPYERWPSLDAMLEVATAAESFGFSDLVFGEHFATPANGKHETLGRTWPEIYVLSSFLAAQTERIRFTYNATVIPYRHPIHQAVQIATLDQLSKGRLTLITGIGWLEEEFAALGIPFTQRGARTDEYMRAMRAIWTDEEAEFHGRYVSFDKVAVNPKCYQQPAVRTLIGGIGAHARRRIVEYGDGWGSPTPWPIDKLAREVVRVKDAVAAAGRDPESLYFSAGISFGEPDPVLADAFGHVGSSASIGDVASPSETIDVIGRYRDIGFTDLMLSTNWTTPSDLVRRLEFFRSEILPSVDGQPS
jgi:probable F420-dependent oxidoreductase